MTDWIGLAIIVLILVGGLCGMARLGTPPKPLTPAEFEERVRQSQGTMSAGVAGMMYALQKLMHPKAAEAVEVMKDLRAGYYDDSEEPDGDDQPGPADANSTPAKNEEGNA